MPALADGGSVTRIRVDRIHQVPAVPASSATSVEIDYDRLARAIHQNQHLKVSGVLSIDERGRAFIEGVADSRIRDHNAFAGTSGRMR